MLPVSFFVFFFFNDTATTEIYTLSLHDALPISQRDAHAIPRQRLVVDDQGAHAILSGHPRAPGKRAGMAGGSVRRRRPAPRFPAPATRTLRTTPRGGLAGLAKPILLLAGLPGPVPWHAHPG